MALAITIVAPPNAAGLSAVAEGLAALSFVQMLAAQRAGRPMPALYESGIVYRREQPRSERWQSAVELLATGQGDCEDLAAYRAAELRLAGEPATVYIKRTARGTFHAIVRRADGTLEDPSRILLDMERNT